MPKTVAEILKMGRDVLVKRPPSAYCCECEIPLRASITGCRDTKRGPMCSDCYFKIMSDFVDDHPICTPIEEME